MDRSVVATHCHIDNPRCIGPGNEHEPAKSITSSKYPVGPVFPRKRMVLQLLHVVQSDGVDITCK